MTSDRILHRRKTVALAAFFLLLFPVRSGAVLVDHIVAAVNNDVITASELAQAVAINRRLGAGGGAGALESETLQGIINRLLLVQEARRLRFVEVSDQDVAAEVAQFRQRFSSDAAFSAFLRSLDMTTRELDRMLAERLIVEKFIEKKVGLFVRVNREEAEHYYESHPAQFSGKTFPEVQKDIVKLLTDRKVGQELDQYVAELRGKADIRINAPRPGD